MIDPRTEDLINAGLDGVLSDEETSELNESLARSAEARDYQASLTRMHNTLQALPPEAMPATLHQNISAAISMRRPQPRPAVFKIAAWPAAVRYGLAASLGMAVAVGIYETQPGTPGSADYRQMMGTIAPQNRDRLENLDKTELSEPGLSSHASLARSPDATMLEIQLDSDKAVDLSIDFADAGLRFQALTQTLNQLESFSVANNVIHARASGQQQFTVLLDHTTEARSGSRAEIRIEYSRDGKLIQRRSLTVF